MAIGAVLLCAGSAATPARVECWPCGQAEGLLGVLARAQMRPFTAVEEALHARRLSVKCDHQGDHAKLQSEQDASLGELSRQTLARFNQRKSRFRCRLR
jgi:hypothetical protein